MEKGLFSVVIVCYNQADLIYDCIDSILEQTYPKIELIIADDHSYDFDYDRLSKYIEKHSRSNLKRYEIFTNEKNLGIVRNCNKGCSLAQGEFMKSIAADDTFYDDEVFVRIAKKLKIPQNGIVCTRAKAIQSNGKPTNDMYPSDADFRMLSCLSNDELYRYLVTRPWSPIFAPGVFWRNELFQEIGGYDESYVFTEDWPCWVKLAREGVEFCFVDDITVKYRYGGISNHSAEQTPNLLRKVHYNECIRMLRNEYQHVKDQFGKGAALRCWHSAEAIEMRSVLEYDWKWMGFFQKLKYRIKKLPVICYIKLMVAINYDKRFHIKNELIISTIFACLLITDRQLLPQYDSTTFTAWMILLLLGLIGLKMIANFLLFLLRKRAFFKTRMTRG